MKKLIALALGLIMSMSFVACSDKSSVKDDSLESSSSSEEISSSEEASASEETDSLESGDAAQIPNPFVDCKTIEEAAEIAGFTVTVPEKLPEGYTQDTIQAVENQMVQIVYTNGENKMTIRKAKGAEDISGDFNSYAEDKALTVGDVQVATKGNDGKVSVATWANEEYTYSISVSPEEAALDSAVVSELVGGIR